MKLKYSGKHLRGLKKILVLRQHPGTIKLKSLGRQ